MKKAIITLLFWAMSFIAGCTYYVQPDSMEMSDSDMPHQPLYLRIEPEPEDIRELERATNMFVDQAIEFAIFFHDYLILQIGNNYDFNLMTGEEILNAMYSEALVVMPYYYENIDKLLHGQFGDNYKQIVDVVPTLHLWWSGYVGRFDHQLDISRDKVYTFG